MTKKRMHPLIVLESIVSSYQNIFFLLILLGSKSFWTKIIFIVVLVLTVSYGIIRYFTTTFEVKDDVIVYKFGVFEKNTKNINIHNIQTLDTTANAIYQVLNLVSLDINILNDNISLKPISKKTALDLIKIINNIRDENVEKEKENNEDIYKLTVKDLAFCGVLRVRPFVVLFAFLGFYNKIKDWVKYIFDDDHIVDDLIAKQTASISHNMRAILILAVIFLILLFIGSAIYMIVRYFDFLITKKDGNLLCKYGLLNKKSIIIDLARLQSISIEKPLRYRIFGLARLNVVTLSTKVSDDLSTKSKINVIPLAKEQFVTDFVKDNLQVDLDKYDNLQFEKIPKRAKFIMYRWTLINCLVLPLLLGVIFYFSNIEKAKNYAIIGSLTLYFVLIGYYGLAKYYKIKNSAVAYTDERFINVKTNIFEKITEYVKLEKVGSLKLETNYFLEKNNLAHITINSIGISSDITLKYFDKSYKDKLASYFLKEGDSNG